MHNVPPGVPKNFPLGVVASITADIECTIDGRRTTVVQSSVPDTPTTRRRLYAPKNLPARYHSQRTVACVDERLNGDLPVDVGVPSRPNERKVADVGAGKG